MFHLFLNEVFATSTATTTYVVVEGLEVMAKSQLYFFGVLLFLFVIYILWKK